MKSCIPNIPRPVKYACRLSSSCAPILRKVVVQTNIQTHPNLHAHTHSLFFRHLCNLFETLTLQVSFLAGTLQKPNISNSDKIADVHKYHTTGFS